MNEVLTDIRNLPPRPFDNAVFIGPSAVDLSLLQSPIAPTETALLAKWRADDLASFYRVQRSNKWKK